MDVHGYSFNISSFHPGLGCHQPHHHTYTNTHTHTHLSACHTGGQPLAVSNSWGNQLNCQNRTGKEMQTSIEHSKSVHSNCLFLKWSLHPYKPCRLKQHWAPPTAKSAETTGRTGAQFFQSIDFAQTKRPKGHEFNTVGLNPAKSLCAGGFPNAAAANFRATFVNSPGADFWRTNDSWDHGYLEEALEKGYPILPDYIICRYPSSITPLSRLAKFLLQCMNSHMQTFQPTFCLCNLFIWFISTVCTRSSTV